MKISSELKKAFEEGKTLQYRRDENDEWHDFSKNTVCDDFKFQKDLEYKIKICKFKGWGGKSIDCEPDLCCGNCEFNTYKSTLQKIEYSSLEYDYITLLNFIDWFAPDKKINDKVTEIAKRLYEGAKK